MDPGRPPRGKRVEVRAERALHCLGRQRGRRLVAGLLSQQIDLSPQVRQRAVEPGQPEPLRADPGRNAAILARIPAGRWGEPDDLQGAAVVLASSASAYVNGAVLLVDGGWMAR